MPTTVLIPALQPSEGLIPLVEELAAEASVSRILVIDDGSGEAFHDRFEQSVAQDPKVELIRHPINLGKGTALRTGLSAFLADEPGEEHVLVTADADGQHLAKDILAVARAGHEEPQALVLGSRAFGDDTPLRSRFGNSLTKWVFRLLTGRYLRDTQTGLRAIPHRLMPTLLRLNSRRYQFELEMLLTAWVAGIPFRKVPIETVYIDHNAASHFNPVIDSVRIYWVFVRFVMFYLLPRVLDVSLFALLTVAGVAVAPAVLIGRAAFALTRLIRARLSEPDGLAAMPPVRPGGVALWLVEALMVLVLTLATHKFLAVGLIGARIAVEVAVVAGRVIRFRWGRRS